MRKLDVAIEIRGKMKHMGTISGNDANDAVFQYADDVIQEGPAISLCLPLQKEAFT